MRLPGVKLYPQGLQLTPGQGVGVGGIGVGLIVTTVGCTVGVGVALVCVGDGCVVGMVASGAVGVGAAAWLIGLATGTVVGVLLPIAVPTMETNMRIATTATLHRPTLTLRDRV